MGSLDSAATLDAEDTATQVELDTHAARLTTHGIYVVSRTADSASLTNSNTLANDDTLTAPVVASSCYLVEAYLLITAANTTMDVRLAWDVPTSGTLRWGPNGRPATDFATWGASAAAATPNSPHTEAQTYIHGTLAGAVGVALFGILETAGTVDKNLTLKWAQNTPDAGALQMAKNSLLRLHKVR